MKRILLWGLPLMMSSVCHAEDITIRYKGETAKVEQKAKDSVKVSVDGAKVNIESMYQDHKLTLILTGKSDDGQLVLKTAGKAKGKLDLSEAPQAYKDIEDVIASERDLVEPLVRLVPMASLKG